MTGNTIQKTRTRYNRFISGFIITAMVFMGLIVAPIQATADTVDSSGGAFTLTKSGNTSTVPAGGGNVTYTYTVQNNTGFNLYFNSIEDASCTNMTYQSGLSTNSSTGVSYIPAGGTATWTCTNFVTQNTTSITDSVTAVFSTQLYTPSSEQTATAHWPVTVSNDGGGTDPTPGVCNNIYGSTIQQGEYINQYIYNLVQNTDGTETYNRTEEHQIGGGFDNGSAALALTPDGRYFYYIDYSTGPLYRIDNTTGATTYLGYPPFTSVKMTADPNGDIWALDTYGRLWKFTVSTSSWAQQTSALIADVYYDGTSMQPTIQSTTDFTNTNLINGDIVFDGQGNLWILGTANGDINGNGLYLVTKDQLATGGTIHAKQINYIPGVTSTSVMNGIAFGADGMLYASNMNSTTKVGNIYTIDPSTGERSAAPVQTYNTSSADTLADLASCALPQSNLNADKTYEPAGPVAVGDTITYTITVENIGNLPTAGSTLNDTSMPTNATYVAGTTKLNGITVPDISGKMPYDNNPGLINSPNKAPGVIGPGESATVTFQATVNSGATGEVCNQAEINFVGNDQGVILTDDPNTPDGTDNSCVKIATPGIDVVKSADKTVITGTETVVYSYKVTNTGNDPLSPVVVSDDKCSPVTFVNGDGNANNILEPEEEWIYTCTKDLVAGNVQGTETNIATATGTGTVSNEVVEDTDTWTVTTNPAPVSIDLEHYVNTIDADTPNGPTVDGDVLMTYTVENTGDLPITNPTIVDDNGTPSDTSDDTIISGTPLSGDTNNNGILDPGEIWTYERIVPSVEGQYTGGSTVTGTTTNGTVTDADPVNYNGVNPQINVETTANDQENALVTPGQPVDWQYVVTNPGTDPVSNVEVIGVDGTPTTYVSGDTDGDGQLDPGEVWIYEQTLPAESTPYIGNGTATGTGPETVGTDGQPQAGTTVTDTDPAQTTPQAANVNIETTVNGVEEAVGKTGSTATWQYVVTSPDQQPLTDVVVTAVDGTQATYVSGDIDGDGILDPNESWIFTSTTTVGPVDEVYIGTGTVNATSYGNNLTDTDPAQITSVDCPPPTTITDTITNTETTTVTTTDTLTETNTQTNNNQTITVTDPNATATTTVTGTVSTDANGDTYQTVTVNVPPVVTPTETVTNTETVNNTITDTVTNTETTTETVNNTQTNNNQTVTVTDPNAVDTTTSTSTVSTDANGNTFQTVTVVVPPPATPTETITNTLTNNTETITVTDPNVTEPVTSTVTETDANGNTFTTVTVTVPEATTPTVTNTETVTTTETVNNTQTNNNETITVTDPNATETTTETGTVSTDANGDTYQTVTVNVPPVVTPTETVTNTETVNNTITDTVTNTETATITSVQNNNVETITVSDPAATSTTTQTGTVSTAPNGDTNQTVTVVVPEQTPATVTNTETDTQTNNIETITVSDPNATDTTTETGTVSTDANGDTYQTITINVPTPVIPTETVTNTITETVNNTVTDTITSTQNNNVETITVSDPAATSTTTQTGTVSTAPNGDTNQTVTVVVPEQTPSTITNTATETVSNTQTNNVETVTISDPAATSTTTETGTVSTDTNGNTFQTITVNVPTSPAETLTETVSNIQTNNIETITVGDPNATDTTTETGTVSTDSNGDTYQIVTVNVPVPSVQTQTITETAPVITITDTVTETSTITDNKLTQTVYDTVTEPSTSTVTTTDTNGNLYETVIVTLPEPTATVTSTVTDPAITVTPTETAPAVTITPAPTTVPGETVTVNPTVTAPITITDTVTSTITPTVTVGTVTETSTIVETVDVGTVTQTITDTETVNNTATITLPAITETMTSTVTTTVDGGTTTTTVTAEPITVTNTITDTVSGTSTQTDKVRTITVSDPSATATVTETGTVSTDSNGNTEQTVTVVVPEATSETETITNTETVKDTVKTITVSDPSATSTTTVTGPVNTATNGDTDQTITVKVPEKTVDANTVTVTENGETKTVTQKADTVTNIVEKTLPQKVETVTRPVTKAGAYNIDAGGYDAPTSNGNITLFNLTILALLGMIVSVGTLTVVRVRNNG